jgi:hypothetical protein
MRLGTAGGVRASMRSSNGNGGTIGGGGGASGFGLRQGKEGKVVEVVFERGLWR